MGCASSASTVNGADGAGKKPNSAEAQKAEKQRRRLSVAPGHVGDITPGAAGDGVADEENKFNLTEVELKAKGSLVHAVVSRKGFVPYSKKKVNQDRPVLKYAVGDDPNINLYGVMDGHGEFGHFVSSFVQTKLPVFLGQFTKELPAEPDKHITEAVRLMCAELADTSINVSFSGTTAVFGVHIGDKLYVANIGDSRCVMAQNDGDKVAALELSEDHKPENPAEKQRILDHGGRVETLPGPPGEDCGPYRVWLAQVDVPGLAMSRSIGDDISQTVGVISVPEIRKHTICDRDMFAIWASDGVWEFISSQEAIDLVFNECSKNGWDLQAAATALVEESTKRWKLQEEVIDDITCTIIQFNKQGGEPDANGQAKAQG